MNDFFWERQLSKFASVDSGSERSIAQDITPIEVSDDPSLKESGEGGHWGYHLILDISKCNEKIDDVDAVRSFLKDLVTELKMKTIGPPMIVRVRGEEGRGLTAVQIITTSSITFHADDEEWCVYIDVFSCKTFDPDAATNLVKKYFRPEHIGRRWLYRDAGPWPK